jgi:hypothetical protein
MRQTFDDYNEVYEMIDGSATIHPHHLGLLKLRGISNNGPFGKAKQCVINAFDTNYLLFADEVMANILHLALNMEDELPGADATVPSKSASPIPVFVAARRGSHGGRGNYNRGSCGGRGLPNKCSGCGSLDHILSSYAASDDTLMKWTLAKRKLIAQKNWQPQQHCPRACCPLERPLPRGHLSAYSLDFPILEEYTDVYDDTKVSLPSSYVAFFFSLDHGRDISDFWVVDSACSINLAACRDDFVTFEPPSGASHIGGAGVDVQSSGTIRLAIPHVFGHIIHRIIRALFTPDLSLRSSQCIGCLLSVRWMRSHCGCKFLFLTDSDIGLLVVST